MRSPVIRSLFWWNLPNAALKLMLTVPCAPRNELKKGCCRPGSNRKKLTGQELKLDGLICICQGAGAGQPVGTPVKDSMLGKITGPTVAPIAACSGFGTTLKMAIDAIHRDEAKVAVIGNGELAIHEHDGCSPLREGI